MGLKGTGHGADLPNNALAGGYNHNVYRNNGIIAPSGAFIRALTPLPSTDAMNQAWDAPKGYIPIRGKGLFYFTSDFGNLKTLDNTLLEHPALSVPGAGGWDGTSEWIDQGDPVADGNYMLGKYSPLNPSEYYILGTRRPFLAESNNGECGMALHIYCVDRSLTYQDTPNGTNNGWLIDIPMGKAGFYDGNISEYFEQNNSSYSTGFFPVFYESRGGVRVCDGGFLDINSSKLFIGYQKDSKYFSPVYDTSSELNAQPVEDDQTSGWTNSNTHPHMEVDQWVIDKGHATAPGLLASPLLKGLRLDRSLYGYSPYNSSQIGANNIVDRFEDKNTVYFIHTESLASDSFSGKSFSNMLDIIPHSEDNAQSFGQTLGIETPEGLLAIGISFQTSESLNDYNNAQNDEAVLEYYNSLEGNINILELKPSNIAGSAPLTVWVSYLYNTGEESVPTYLNEIASNSTYSDPGSGSNFLNTFIYGEGLLCKLSAMVNSNKAKAHPRIQGARVYLSNSFINENIDVQKDSELAFVGEIRFDKGLRGSNQSSYNIWQYASDKTFNEFDYKPWYYAQSDWISSLGTETFKTFHGYDWNEIKPCYYKTATTINNRVYVGNVKFNDVLYPDRMMKTQIGEFDTFTENGFIDVSVDDGESIVHLESFANRILQFKENTLHIINIEKQFEYLENSVKYAGVKSPCQVVATEVGIFWANVNGLFVYNGQAVKNLLDASDLNIMSGPVTLSGDKEPVLTLSQWSNVISEKEGFEPIVTYNPKSKEIVIVGQSTTDFGFIWNIQRGILTQIFDKTSGNTNGIKSNSIITIDGDVLYMEGNQYDATPALRDPANISVAGEMRKWDSSAQDLASDKLALFLLTKSIDFGNHSQRKVVQSISFTYKSTGLSRLLPYVKVWYLDGTSPDLYYLCNSSASSISSSDIIDDANANMQLPGTSNRFETFKYNHVLASGSTGDATSMRTILKNCGAIQIGLIRNDSSGSVTDSTFELEEIAITYREKRVR